MDNEDEGWSMPSLTNGSNKVPSIYYEDFLSLMLNILQPNIITDDLENNSTWSFPLYIPAVDCSTSSILETYTTIARDKCAFSTYINKSNIIDSVMTDPRNQLWSLDICFSNNSGGFPSTGIAQKFKNGLNDESLLKTLWDNYLSCNNLSPVSIMIAGPKDSGKTSISKVLAEKLNLQYIDVPSSLRYLMDTFKPPTLPVVEPVEGETPVMPNEEKKSEELPIEPEEKPSIYQTLRSELCASLESIMSESKKLKKGEEPTPVDVSTTEFTDSLCIQIKPSIVRRSIAAYIQTSKKCNLTGYLVDIWSVGLLTDKSTYLETITGNTEETGDIKSKLVELVVELQITDEKLMSRLMEKLGIAEGTQAKASKDNQALLKNLEVSCATYKEKMKEIPDSNDPENNITSHEVIIDISNSANDHGTTLCRVDTTPLSMDDCVVHLLEKIVEVHGKIGWVDNDATVPVNTIIDEVKEEVKEESKEGEFKEEELKELEVIASESVAVEGPIVKSTPTIQSGMDKVNSNIINLVPEDQATLLAKCDVLQSFLGVTILPHVTQGMVQIARQYPDDPIMFLAEYLKQTSIEVEEKSEAAAKLDFYNTLEAAKTEEF
jgi:cytidylate kinase